MKLPLTFVGWLQPRPMREGFFVARVLLCSHGKASFNFLASLANECFQSCSDHLQPGEARATEQRTRLRGLHNRSFAVQEVEAQDRKSAVADSSEASLWL